jgi:8-oxo-dGTP diphosphatase
MDALFRVGFRLAYRLLRAWWLVRRPEARGAAVAAWAGGRLLVVRTSYRPELDLPGGGIARGEAPIEAAARELREETGLDAAPSQLADQGVYRFRQDRRRITTRVFTWRPGDAARRPTVDNREIVWAGYLTPAELLRVPTTPVLRCYLDSLGQLCNGTRQISRA